MDGRGSLLNHASAGFFHQMFDDGPQVVGFLIDAELAFGTGALVQDGVNVFDGAATPKVVDYIVHKLEQFGRQLAHRYFGFLAEVDQLAFDAIARRTPFVLLNERAAVEAETHVPGVQAVQLDDDGLRERGNGHGLFDFRGDVAHAELQRPERRVRAHVPPDFLSGVDAVELDQEIREIFVGAPGLELLGNAGARKAAEYRSAKRFQAGVASHPERGTRGERKKVRQEIAHHVHYVDGGLLVGHGNVNVHAEDQERARELLQLFDDILIAFAGRDDLIDPARERVRARGGDLQADAFRGGYEFAARAVHFDAQLAHVFTDVGAGFDDGLVHLVLDLLDDVGRSGGHQLQNVRAQLARGWIDDLEFLFYANRKAVSHEVALRGRHGPAGGGEAVSYAARRENTSGRWGKEILGKRQSP